MLVREGNNVLITMIALRSETKKTNKAKSPDGGQAVIVENIKNWIKSLATVFCRCFSLVFTQRLHYLIQWKSVAL